MRVQTPGGPFLVVDDGGYVAVFRDINELQRHIEADDVVQSILRFFSAKGTLLAAEADPEAQRVTLLEPKPSDMAPEELAEALRRFFERVDMKQVGLSNKWLRAASLEDLVAARIQLEEKRRGRRLRHE